MEEEVKVGEEKLVGYEAEFAKNLETIEACEKGIRL
jgi:hypothetical protein